MVKYLITESEKTALESKICEIAGISGPLEFPDGFVSAINSLAFSPLLDIKDIIDSNRSAISMIIDNYISIIRPYAFYKMSYLTSVTFNNCNVIGAGAFYYCSNLSYAFFPKVSWIENDAFPWCENLFSLYLLSSQIVQLEQASYQFRGTPLSTSALVSGNIFVPMSLLDTYKNNDMWYRFSSYLVGVE